VHHSLANVNCEMARALAKAKVDLGLVPYEVHQFDVTVDTRYGVIADHLQRRPARVDCHVRHRWPPRFIRPPAGAFVVLQPWEYGSLPRRWVAEINRRVDELWVPSRWVRDVSIGSGVDRAKVVVIPQGVDPEVFCPEAPPARLDTRRTFRFLFVGGSLERKGFDILLKTYGEMFTSADDVCLVIKDFFYGGAGRAAVAALRRRRRAPEVLYIDGNLPARAIAGFYTASNCYVHPYRGEGFGLPIIEAMACGLPVITTGRGPALDYCTPDNAYLVPAEEQPVGDDWDARFPTVRQPTWFEPDRRALRDRMREVFDNRDAARRVGVRASADVRRHFTWQRAATAVVKRVVALQQIRSESPPIARGASRRWTY
jgi:glycosyltransferase involved in cell wall biosynthesis